MKQVESLTAALRGLIPASDAIERDAPDQAFLQQVIDNGILRPAESEILCYWFARYLSVRASLWEVIGQAVDTLGESLPDSDTAYEWRHFIVAYSAACLLVRNDRLMLFRVAKHSLIQRKLNEALPEYRISRKQYTNIFSAYVDTRDALQIYRAMQVVKAHRQSIEQYRSDSQVGFLVERLSLFETWLDPRRRNYLKWLGAYLSHKWRRKSVVSLTRTLASVVEGFGRVASELRVRDEKKVTSAVQSELAELLRPGDIVITRHELALTNLFLPGFWPHAALYIGFDTDRQALGLKVDDTTAKKWSSEKCFLEALKDGVRFRPMFETMKVDNVLVLRPHLSQTGLREALNRVVEHEGKMYNFDFDFFSAESLVCTEVIYRAFDGLEDLEFPLSERAGRFTLSAEDIIRYALSSGKFEIIAVFGVDGCENRVVAGEAARPLITRSVASSA